MSSRRQKKYEKQDWKNAIKADLIIYPSEHHKSRDKIIVPGVVYVERSKETGLMLFSIGASIAGALRFALCPWRKENPFHPGICSKCGEEGARMEVKIPGDESAWLVIGLGPFFYMPHRVGWCAAVGVWSEDFAKSRGLIK